ncbi:MAG: lyase domain protein repeat-containing protein, partial [Labilithrix sp.]|nr:lyase domain protein repeat-containing protein [Labilithrix sp.]
LARAIRDFAGSPETTKSARERFDELLIRLAREAGTFRDLGCASNLGLVDDRSERLAGAAMIPTPSPFALEMGPEVRVRLEVARAMATRKSPAFLPILVGMLNRHELRSTARATIAQIPGALEFVDEVMRQRDYARDVRIHLPRTLVLFEPNAAARKLMAHLLSESDGAVRYKVIRALVKLRRANPKLFLEGDLLRRVVESNLDHAEELHRWGLGLAGVDEDAPPASVVGSDPLRAGHHLLLDLVRDKERHARQRLFMLLELLYGEDFDDIERGLRSTKPKTRASSLELLENIIRPPLRSRVLELVGDGPIIENLPSYEETLSEILSRAGTTMRTLAEYRAVELGLDIGALTGTRPSQTPTIESLGKRLVDRARGLLSPDGESIDGAHHPGVTRAPA